MPSNQNSRNACKRIAKNFLWLLMQLGITRILGLILSILIARALLKESFGHFSYYTSYTRIFIIISDLGLSALLLREISRFRERTTEIFSQLFAAKFILLIISFILCTGSLLILTAEGNLFAVIALISAFYLESTAAFISTVFKANEKMHFVVMGESIYKSILLILCFAALAINNSFVSVSAAYCIASLLFLVFFIIVTNAHYSFINHMLLNFSKHLRDFSAVLKSALPMAIGGMIAVIYINTDVIMLKWFKGPGVTGSYAAGYSLYLGMGLISSLIAQSFLPRLSLELEKKNTSIVDQILLGSIKILTVTSIPLGLCGIFLAPQVLEITFGDKYLDAVPAFRIFMLIILINYLNLVFSYYLFACKKQVEMNKIYAFSVGLNVALNAILIPFFTMIGAAIATMCAEVAFAVIFIFRYRSFVNYFMSSWMIPAARALSCFLILYILLSLIIPSVVSACFAVLLYILIILSSGVLNNELSLLKGLRVHG